MHSWLELLIFSTLSSGIFAHTIPDDNLLYELVVHRRLDTGLCTHTSLRQTIQQHKDLETQDVVEERSLFTPRGERAHRVQGEGNWERLRYFFRDRHSLWTRALGLCGPESTWSQTMLVDSEELFTTPGHQNKQSHFYLSDKSSKQSEDTPLIELIPLVQTGPSSNRVDLTFFSDGYTVDERSKFLDDAHRLALDISSNHTFNTVKPLMNFWAAFVPSHDSGVGVGGKAKDTAFGLYRDGTELRGVYYSKPEKARAACFSLGDKCDYPVLVGNDPLYGGLGGEFTVITPSILNGPLVLRHELGHSIIDVGEEYDGGFAYFGVNAFPNDTVPSWAHWLTPVVDDPHNIAPRTERSIMPLQNYAWTVLNTSTAWRTTFTSSGTYAHYLVRFSLSGLPDASDLRVELDGHDLGWVPAPGVGDDRWHYDIHVDKSLADGEHEVAFTLLNGKRKVAQLCSVEILEFGDEHEFKASPGVYSLFPTFSEGNMTTYRPTNEDCLMRLVTSPNFCSVCLEELWLALARRVSLIDAIDTSVSCNGNAGQQSIITLTLVPLAHLRDGGIVEGERYNIQWAKDGNHLPKWDDQTEITLGNGDTGTYAARVYFKTDEVRKDPKGYLSARGEVTIAEVCP